MKIIFTIIPLLIIGCSKSVTPNEISMEDNKSKTIDSLKTELIDCKGQAKIMADILEKERLELQNKKDIKK